MFSTQIMLLCQPYEFHMQQPIKYYTYCILYEIKPEVQSFLTLNLFL
jgi:hypothetical protein